MSEEMKNNLLNIKTYQRLALMLIFVVIYGIVELIIYAIAIFQWGVLLFTGKLYANLKEFGAAIAAYLYDIVKFLTFETEHLPFPFESWHYNEPKEEREEPKNEDTQ